MHRNYAFQHNIAVKEPVGSDKLIKSIHEWSSLSKELALERKRDKRSKKNIIIRYYCTISTTEVFPGITALLP